MQISKEQAEKYYLDSVSNHNLSNEKAIIFYSKKALDFRLDLLKESFPENTKHAIAIKTCNQIDVLSHIVKRGFGLEAASFEELLLAKEAGIENHNIVFDSPVKTRDEIQKCHTDFPGILLNANSLEELARYPDNFNGKIGLRINPLIENSGGSYFNVATYDSKFGVPITNRKEILDHCIQHTSISCLHLHIGSNLKDLSPNIKAISKVCALAVEINELREKKGINSKIDTLDIGGGIEFDKKSIRSFVNSIQEIKNIEQFSLVTEYGNFIHKHNSFAVSNIEYVIPNSNNLPSTAYIHIGADLFVRKIYSSINVKYPFSVLHQQITLKNRETINYNIVGPLCFAGDIVFRDIQLEELNEGDKFFIYNIGSNTLSMWSGHCSRSLPKFIFLTD